VDPWRDSAGLLVAAFLIGLNGFFVAAEFALVRVRRSQLDEMVERGEPFADSAQWLVEHLDSALSATQLGITIASLALGWIGEPTIARLLRMPLESLGLTNETFLHGVSFTIAFTIITALHVVIGELAPKTLAIRSPESLARWCALPLRAFWLASYPVLVVLNATTAAFLKPFGVEAVSENDETPHSEREIRALLTVAREHGEVTGAERELIEGVFEFDDLICRKVMVPRVDVAFFDINESYESLLALIRHTKHTRYPVCDGSLDNVVGVLHVKDIMLATDPNVVDLRTIMRPPRFVPETLSVSKLLRQFQATHQLLAVVVDEYGTTSGIVTLENVLEPIVGPVADEFDIETPEIVPESRGSFLVDGRASIESVMERFNLELGDEEADTLSGYLMARLGHVPEEGDVIELGAVKAEVLEVRKSRAERIRVTLPLPDKEQDTNREPDDDEQEKERAAD
jgi:CBS domain containing-hemolysin-like protein